MRKFRFITIFFIIFYSISCASVPRETVELSATVGRDITEMKIAHLALLDLYYSELIGDINSFIDDVYLPFQIQYILGDEDLRNKTISEIDSAGQPDPTDENNKKSIETNKNPFENLEMTIHMIRKDVEDYRKEILSPVQEQFLTIQNNLNNAYGQINYANSIVTGHLASIVKVHDTQNEIWEKLDLNNIRTEVGTSLAGLSVQIRELIKKTQKGEQQISEIINEFKGLITETY